MISDDGVACPLSTGKPIGKGMRRPVFSNMPIFYECQRCTACCRWPGLVRLTDAEIGRLAAAKGLSEYDFIQRFTCLRPDRRGLVLLNKANGECVFLEGQDCAVQSVKPQQCRDFPNLWNFPGFEKVCRALPRSLGQQEMERELLAATGRLPGTTSSSINPA